VSRLTRNTPPPFISSRNTPPPLISRVQGLLCWQGRCVNTVTPSLNLLHPSSPACPPPPPPFLTEFKDHGAVKAEIMMDKMTQRSRGFGFVYFQRWALVAFLLQLCASLCSGPAVPMPARMHAAVPQRTRQLTACSKTSMCVTLLKDTPRSFLQPDHPASTQLCAVLCVPACS
jgi:hypothetical protein